MFYYIHDSLTSRGANLVMRARTTSAIVMAVMLAALCPSADPAEPTMLEIFKDGEVALSFRYRFEGVNDDAFTEDAKASTLRSRLSFSSGAYRNMSFFVEAQDVRELFPDDFNSGGGTSPGRSQYIWAGIHFGLRWF